MRASTPALHVDRVGAGRARAAARRSAGSSTIRSAARIVPGCAPGDAERPALPEHRALARRRPASRRSRCRRRGRPQSAPASAERDEPPLGHAAARAEPDDAPVRKPGRARDALLGRRRAGERHPVSVHAMLRTVSLTLPVASNAADGSKPEWIAAVLAARVVARAVVLPLDALEQRLVGREDAVGEQVARALPAVRVARDRAPRRARELPLAGEEVLVDRARQPAVAVLAGGRADRRGTSPRARRASSSAPGRSASTGSRARSASRRCRRRS